MKIGIISSGSETLTLFKFLSKYDHEYIVYYDFFHWPYGDKTFLQGLACVQEGVNYLLKQGVDYIIVPPIYELALIDGKMEKWEDGKFFPLFTTYLKNYCFAYSLVGKIGFFGDFADVETVESLIKKFTEAYVLSAHQKAIKKFHVPFVYWVKETPLWKYYLSSLSYSHILVNKIIKFDLRYFKDAMVDTLIPLSYGYFNYQTTITKYLNFKKIRFHTLDTLEESFTHLVNLSLKPTKYSVTVWYTGNVEFLKREKRMMWLLQKGKDIDIVFKEV